MRSNRSATAPLRNLSIAVGVAMLVGFWSTVEARETLQPGMAAPDFSIEDSSGRMVSLAAFKGRSVVLEWTNHECPYVARHYGTGTMQQLQKDATAKGVVWLSVVSSSAGRQGHVNGLEADKLTADRKAHPTGVLLDAQGKIGRLYGATTTPHMFVVDPAGKLAYMGAIDDKPSTSPSNVKGARAYVREALDAIAAGQPVKTASTRPYGCSVKYSDPRS